MFEGKGLFEVVASMIVILVCYTNCSGFSSTSATSLASSWAHVGLTSKPIFAAPNATGTPMSTGEAPVSENLSFAVSTFCSQSGTSSMGGNVRTLCGVTERRFYGQHGCSQLHDFGPRHSRRSDQFTNGHKSLTFKQSVRISKAGTYTLSLQSATSSDLLWGDSISDVFNNRTQIYDSRSCAFGCKSRCQPTRVDNQPWLRPIRV